MIWFVLACGQDRGATIVGNPGSMTVQASETDDGRARVQAALLTSCDGEVERIAVKRDFDLARPDDAIALPEGTWCGVGVELDDVRAGDLDLGAFTAGVTGTFDTTAALALRLGGNGWPDADHPLQALLAGTELLRDDDGDGVGDTVLDDVGASARRFVAVGEGGTRTTSANGVDWDTPQTGDQPLKSVAYGDGVWLTVGGDDKFDVQYTSADGLGWTGSEGDLPGHKGVTSGMGLFVAVGHFGRRSVSPTGGAIEWTEFEDPDTPLYTDVTYGDGTFVAVGGGGTRAASSDGETWSSTSSGSTLLDVAFGDGVFVAVGENGRRTRSVDGSVWTDDVEEGLILNAVAWGDGLWVAGGEDRTLTSPDGIDWTEHTGVPFIESLAWANGTFVAVGGNERHTSTDGISWTQVAAEGQTLFDIAYGD